MPKLKKKETKPSRKNKLLSGGTAPAVRYQLGKAKGLSSSLYQVPFLKAKTKKKRDKSFKKDQISVRQRSSERRLKL